MPRIPMLGQPSAPSSAVDLGATPNRRGAQAIAGSVEQLGRVIEGFGQNLLEKRTQAEISTYTSKGAMDLELESQKWDDELKTKYANDPKGYAQEYQEKLGSWQAERLTQAPNEQAKDTFSKYMNQATAKTVGQASAWEKQQTAKNYITDISSTANQARQTILKKPDTAMAAGLFTNQLQMIDAQTGVSYDKSQAEKLKMDLGTQYADSLLDGMLANKQYDAGNKFLNGEDRAGGEFLKYVDADKLGHFKARFKAGQDEQMQISKSILNKQLGDYKEALMSGAKIDPSVGKQLKTSLAGLPDAEKNYINDDIANAEKINANLNTLKVLPLQQAEALLGAKVVPQDDGTAFNMRARSEAQSAYETQAKAIIKQRRENPVQYYMENDIDVQNAAKQATDIKNPEAMSTYVEIVRTKQQADGTPFKRVVTDQMASSYKSMLMANDPALAVQAESQLRRGFGKHSGLVMADLARDEKFQPYATAFSIQNPEAKQDMLRNIKNEKEIATLFQQSKYNDKDIKQVYQGSNFQNFNAALGAADPTGEKTWLRNGIGKLVELEAKNLVNNGESISSAREKAFKKVVTDNWDVADSRNSKVILPKAFNMKDQTEDFIDSFNRPESFDALDIMTPSNYGANLSDPASAPARYKQDLASQGVWVSNGSQDGMYLAKKGKDRLEKVVNSQGKLIEVKFSDMSSLLAKVPKRTTAGRAGMDF